MSIRQKTTYETDDGQAFKTRKEANRHAAELYVTNVLSCTPERFDNIFHTLLDHNLLRETHAAGVTDWRDLCGSKRLDTEGALRGVIVTYDKYTNATALLLGEDGTILHRLDGINLLSDGEEERAIATLTAEAGDECVVNVEKVRARYRDAHHDTRAWYRTLQERHEDGVAIVLVAERKPMTVREKLESGMRLSEDELCGLAYGDERDFDIVHEVKGKNRRWSRSMRTVLKDKETGTLWCVDWEDGLTESQEDGFYDQPYKVTLEQVPVTVTKTTIKKVGE